MAPTNGFNSRSFIDDKEAELAARFKGVNDAAGVPTPEDERIKRNNGKWMVPSRIERRGEGTGTSCIIS